MTNGFLLKTMSVRIFPLVLVMVLFTGCLQDIPLYDLPMVGPTIGPILGPMLGIEPPGAEEAETADKGHTAASDEAEDGEDEDEAAPATPANTGPLKLTEMDRFRETPYEKISLPVSGGDVLTGWLVTPLAVERKKAEALAAMAAANDEDEEDDDDESEEDDAPPATQYPLVVLLHGLNGAYPDWGAFPSRLVEKGYAVLAIDMRGHGASRPRRQDWRRFKPNDWQQLPKDITRIIQYIATPRTVVEGEVKGGLPGHLEVDGQHVWLIGAGVGANTAVLSAQMAIRSKQQPVTLDGMVLLSPTLEYKGLRTLEAMYDLNCATLILASQTDAASNEASPMLYRMISGKKSIKIFESLGHGTDMVRFYPELQSVIMDWMTTIAPAEARPVPEELRFPPEEDDEDEDDEE